MHVFVCDAALEKASTTLTKLEDNICREGDGNYRDIPEWSAATYLPCSMCMSIKRLDVMRAAARAVREDRMARAARGFIDGANM